MDISLIAAIDKNNGIGYENELLFKIKEDFKWFIFHTKSKPVVMGRTTYESIGSPLKGRLNIVLSKDPDYNPHPDVRVYSDIAGVLADLRNEKEIMIIGGSSVYEQFFPYANRLYITKFKKTFKADTFFPKIEKEDWLRCYKREGIEDVGFDYTFNVYKKKLK